MRKYVSYVLVCFIWMPTVFNSPCAAQNLDVNMLDRINPQYPNSNIWLGISHSVYWVPVAAPLGILAHGIIKKDKVSKKNALELVVSVGACAVITQGLKMSFGRTRPADRYPDEIFPNSPNHDNLSFPSGHTSLVFATATTLALEHKKWYVAVPAFAWASSVGYSRMYLGKHYPSDVLGGIAVGIGTSYLNHWLNKKLFRPKPAPQPLEVLE